MYGAVFGPAVSQKQEEALVQIEPAVVLLRGPHVSTETTLDDPVGEPPGPF